MSLGFQDSGSFSMGELSFLHDHVMMIMFMVVVFILYIMSYLVFTINYYKFLSEGTFIESVWSVVPAFLLIVLVFPSMKVLYLAEDVKTPVFSFKILAHQWYWTFAVPLFNNFTYFIKSEEFSFFEYDSLMEEFSFDSSFPRLLGTSSELFLPVGLTSRLLISSTDVIHSFSLPSLGLKVDAFPGRINQLYTSPVREGLYYGQCSEICGSNHSFMPVGVKVLNFLNFNEVSKYFVLDLISDSFSLDYSF